MTTLREAAQQALEILERLHGGCTDSDDGTVEAITIWCPDVIDALRAALAEHFCDTHCTWADHAPGCVRAEPVQEPVAWWHRKSDTFTSGNLVSKFDEWTPLYPAPPQRKPLSEEEIEEINRDLPLLHMQAAKGSVAFIFARAIERAHGIGDNT